MKRSSCTLLQAFSEKQDKLKSRWHTYTNSPPGQFVLLDLLAHRSAEMLIRLPSACRGKTAVQFPASSSHVCCVELALKWLLCTCVGRKGPLSTWAIIRVNTFSWLPRPWWYGCAHALGTGRASFQFFFSISLKLLLLAFSLLNGTYQDNNHLYWGNFFIKDMVFKKDLKTRCIL